MASQNISEEATKVEEKLVSCGACLGDIFVSYIFRKKFGESVCLERCYINNITKQKSHEHYRVRILDAYYDPSYTAFEFLIPDPRDITQQPRYTLCVNLTPCEQATVMKIQHGDFQDYEREMPENYQTIARSFF